MGRVLGLSPRRTLLGSMLVIVLWALALASFAAEQEVAARATAILNQVEALSADGATRRLSRGDLIYVGDILTTGPKGRAQLRFTDRGVMTLRPATRLSIDDYRFDPAAPALNRQNLSVDQGGFRAATGAVADSNREGYRVASPLGVVGVRGTNYEAVLTPSNNLVLGAYEGTIDVTSPTGNVAVLGEGADFNFARVDSSGGVEYLLEPPEELASSAGVADDQEEAEESEEESEESEESEEDSESTEDEGESGDEEADEGEAADEESADDAEDSDAEESAESEEAEDGSAEEGEDAAAEESDEGAGESSEAEESSSEEGGSEEGGAAETEAEADGGGDSDGAAESADSGDGEAAPAETADSSGDSASESRPAPAASDSADAESAGAAETSEAPLATAEDSAAGAPQASSTDAAAPESTSAAAPAAATPEAGVSGDVGGLDSGLSSSTQTTTAAAAPTTPVTTSTSPDASTLASASVDPSSRGALPADQDEPDQAGAIENLIDTDGDGIGDAADLDDDGDGVPDVEDLFPLDSTEFADFDGDGIGDGADLDDDGDGVPDLEDAFAFDPNESSDFDGDGIGDRADLDDDGDGVPDLEDAFAFDPNESSDFDGDGIGDGADLDDDGDGVPDLEDAFALDPNESADFDGDGIGDAADLDDDGDGVPDLEDAFAFDPNESSDFDGDGIGDGADLDDDGDGVPDLEDAFALDPNESADFDGDGIGDRADLDDDGDGVPDLEDAFAFDPNESADFDGDGIGDGADLDDDGDGVPDLEDAFAFDPNESADFDGDGIGDGADLDDDGDGVPDLEDAFAFDPNESADFDGDGIGDGADLDDDGDGVPDDQDPAPLDGSIPSSDVVSDFDSDGEPDSSDLDDDNDGVPDLVDRLPLNPSLLLSAEQVSEIKDESGTGSIVITTGLAAPSASNLSLADGTFDSQAGRGVQAGITDANGTALIFKTENQGFSDNAAEALAIQSSPERESFLFDSDFIVRTSTAEVLETINIYGAPAGLSWSRLVNPDFDLSFSDPGEEILATGQSLLIAVGALPSASVLTEDVFFGLGTAEPSLSVLTSLYTPVRVPVWDAELIIEEEIGGSAYSAFGATASMLLTPGDDSQRDFLAGSLQVALLPSTYSGDPFFAQPSELEFVSLDFLVQSFDGLISTAEICCDGSTVAHGSDGALLAPSSIDLSSLSTTSGIASPSTVPFDGELTGFLSKDPSRSDLFQLSFDLEKSGASDSAIATSVTGLAVLKEAVSSSEKIWLGNFLLGYVAGGKVAESSGSLGRSQFYFAYDHVGQRYFGPEETEFFADPLGLSSHTGLTLGLIRGSSSLLANSIPPVALSSFADFNDPALGGGDLAGESWNYCDTVAGFCTFSDGSAYEYLNVETGLRGTDVTPTFNWISGTPVSVPTSSTARHYFSDGPALDLMRYLTTNSSFSTNWREFDSFSLDFDFDPQTGDIEFGRITAFNADDPSAFFLELDFFGEVISTGGEDFAFFYPIGGSLTEDGVQRDLLSGDDNALGGFFNGANSTSAGNNFVLALDLEFESGDSDKTLRVAGLDVASALNSGSATMKPSEQLPSGGFGTTGLLAFPTIEPNSGGDGFSLRTFNDPDTGAVLPGLAPGVTGIALGPGSSLVGLTDGTPSSGADLRDSFVLRAPADVGSPAIDFRGGQSASTGMRFLALDGIGWGIWDTNPGAPVRAFDSPSDPSLGPVIPGYALYAGGISPAAPNIPGGSVVRYELSFTSNETFAAPFNSDGASILAQRTGTEGSGLNNINRFEYKFDLDLASGAITNGLIDINYTAPSLSPDPCCNVNTVIAWENHFSGSLQAGSSVPSLQTTGLNLCVRGFCTTSSESDALARNRVGGVFSGSNGETFWGTMSLEGRIPADPANGLAQDIIESLQVLVRAPCVSSECLGL